MSTVQSIDRDFAVLRALLPGAAGVTEIADRVQLPKSTVSRRLSTLEELGADEPVSAGGGSRIGAGHAERGAAARPGRTLVGAARPVLVELSRTTGESTGLSVPDGAEMLYLDQVNPDHELQVRDWTGTRIPMHAVPSGQVALAAMTDDRLETYLAAPLAAFTPHTLTDPDAVRTRIAEVRTQGYALAVDEFAVGLSSIAAGIRDHTGRVVGAIQVYGPTYRLHTERDSSRPDQPAELGRLVVEAAGRIELP
ncbi:MAG: IclR family transcriptional regulator [Actinomycetes bacterium]